MSLVWVSDGISRGVDRGQNNFVSKTARDHHPRCSGVVSLLVLLLFGIQCDEVPLSATFPQAGSAAPGRIMVYS
jgi:hypothetical protein